MFCTQCGSQTRDDALFCFSCGADLSQRPGAGLGEDTPAPESTVQEVGAILDGRYLIEEEIGRGGMGIVYKALDKELDMPVALKVLHPRIADRPEAVTQLREEALAAIRLTHPNLVRLHNFENTAQAKYLLMEYVPGQSLSKMLSNGLAAGFTERDVIRIAEQVADGLAAAHKAGIIHRDIKPSNILITPEGQVKILDFGIAHVEDPTALKGGVRQAHAGTPTYMSPEQFLGEKLDGRTDVYALGATMYEVLATHPPFVGGNLKEQHLEDEPEPIPGVSDWLNEIVLRCLEKDPRDRWASAEDFRKALEGDAAPATGLRSVRETDNEPEWRRVARERDRRDRMRKASRRSAAAALPDSELSSPPVASIRVTGKPQGGPRPNRTGPVAGGRMSLPSEGSMALRVSIPSHGSAPAGVRKGDVRTPGLTPGPRPASTLVRPIVRGAEKKQRRHYQPPNSQDGSVRWGIPSGILQFSVGAALVATVLVVGASTLAEFAGLGPGPLLTQMVLAISVGAFWGLAEPEARNILVYAAIGAVAGFLVGLVFSAQQAMATDSPVSMIGAEAIRALLLGGALGAALGRARGVPVAVGLAASLGVAGGLLGVTAQFFIRVSHWYPSPQLDLAGGTILAVIGITAGATIGASAVVTPQKMRL